MQICKCLDKKVSQITIAEKLGVDKTSYGRYENGTVQIKFEQVAQLASFYKMTLDELYNYGNPDFKLEEPRLSYQRKWTVPITVSLDGTAETLTMWINRLQSINAAL